MNDKELDAKLREELVLRWKAATWLSSIEVSEKNLKGKLFSRENIEKSKGEDFDDLLWPRIIKANLTKSNLYNYERGK